MGPGEAGSPKRREEGEGKNDQVLRRYVFVSGCLMAPPPKHSQATSCDEEITQLTEPLKWFRSASC